MMNASANLLAISLGIREMCDEWETCNRNRIASGYEWDFATEHARRKVEETIARAAEIARDAAIARQMREVP